MAVGMGHEPVTEFSQWYVDPDIDNRDGALEFRGIAPCADHLWRMYMDYKREMDVRVANYEVLDKLADGEVISPKPDLPNVSSGETAGIVRRVARNLVQNTPNVEVISTFDDDSIEGIFARHILTSKIIGSDQYSNDMQQNLFSSVKSSFTRGFDAVVPVLMQDAGGSWFIKYDTIHYRDVFPEPGCKDVRDSCNVFVRRYLSRADVINLVRNETPGWDMGALRRLLRNRPPAREQQSVDHQTKKHKQIPDGYPVITWYNSYGDAFLTFSESEKTLLRIEKNKHPLKQHPVFFLILEKDDQQPLGKSQVELLIGRQDFQDLMLNGAMKLWYRNINPSIIGYGTVNSIPNLSPGKYTQISNPNAKLEAFEVNTQTLMQYGQISQQNLGSMVNLVGSADQQMAMSAGGNGQGMSATPQGVEAQTQMVDITTNNYQKAIEGFFSHYCSYALTIFFQEMRYVKTVTPTAEARIKLLKAGLRPYAAHADEETGEIVETGDFNAEGKLVIDFENLATEYWVRCVPGSLVEMEDEKQLRILNQLFVPLSQAMPALGAMQDQTALQHAAAAMQYIIQKEIELSGSAHSRSITELLKNGDLAEVQAKDDRISDLENQLAQGSLAAELEADLNHEAILQLQAQQSTIMEALGALMEKLGVVQPASAAEPNSSQAAMLQPVDAQPTVSLASA